jgi:hypothetical protein
MKQIDSELDIHLQEAFKHFRSDMERFFRRPIFVIVLQKNIILPLG